MVTFGSHVGNHQFQPFLSGVYAGVILKLQHFSRLLKVDVQQSHQKPLSLCFPMVYISDFNPYKWSTHYVLCFPYVFPRFNPYNPHVFFSISLFGPRSRHHGGGDQPGRIQGQNHQRHRPGPWICCGFAVDLRDLKHEMHEKMET